MARALAALGAVLLGLLVAGTVAASPASGGSMTLVFQRTYDGGSADGLAIGPDGSVYTAGFAPGEELYPGSGLFDSDVSILRWGADGDLLWQVRWRGAGDESAEAVAVDSTRAAYVTGSTTSFGGHDAFLLKFDADGNLLWQRTWGGTHENGGKAVVVGADESVYVAGTTQNFGSFFGTSAFLVRFGLGGEILWERTWQAEGGTIAEDIAMSTDGALYLVGNVDRRPFLAKFTAGGDLLWDRTFVAPGLVGGDTAVFLGIAAAPDGGAVAVGRWMPTFDGEVLVVRFAPDGSIVWTRDWGGDSHEEGIDAVVAADGTVYVVGHTDTFADGAYEDIFVLKMLSSGRGTEIRTWGGPNRDRGHGIALAPDGELCVAGSATFPPFTFGSAPSQMSRVRGSAAVDADAVVDMPAGTLGSPTGTTNALDGTVGTGDRGGAVLLRVRPS